MKAGETSLIGFSHKHPMTDINVSFAFTFTRPFCFRGSLQWDSSNKMQSSAARPFQSQGLKISTAFRTNRFLFSLSYLPSILPQTIDFLFDIDEDLKASLESVKITSASVGGGAFIAIIAIVCLSLLFHRTRRKRQNGTQIERESFDEFDLPTEHSDEEPSDEEESFFDLENREKSDSDDPFESDSFVSDPIRGGDDLRVHFDGEESF
jgi:hypothetical protein